MKWLLGLCAAALVITAIVWMGLPLRQQILSPTPEASVSSQSHENRAALQKQAESAESEDGVEVNSVAPGPVTLTSKPKKPASLTDDSVAETTPGNPEVSAITVLENVRGSIRQFAQQLGENPVGDNAEITAALNGKNAKQAVFIAPDDGIQINSKGQLVDAWGTPFFFHQLSRVQMEIQSAGPDRRLWTADDLVLK